MNDHTKILDAMTASLAAVKNDVLFGVVGVATSEGCILVALGTEWNIDQPAANKLRDDMAELIRKFVDPDSTMVKITNPSGQA